MQKQFSENWNKLYQCVSKPISDIAQLNINTLSNWSKNTGTFEELTQSKKPDDFLWTQMKLANMGHLETITYAKKVGDIWADAMTEINEICGEMLRETTAKASEVIKSGNKSKE